MNCFLKRIRTLLPSFALCFSFPAPAPAQDQPVFHGSRKGNRVALTFDACPTKNGIGYDRRIVRILQATQTPACFFLSGRWLEAQEAGGKELAAEPLFELGNHGWSHSHMTSLTEEEMLRELTAAQALLERCSPKATRFFRPPFGEWDPRLLKTAAQGGWKTIQYDLASGDPDPHFTAPRLADYVVAAARPGSIIVLHVNGNGRHTAEALPSIIERLRGRGLVLARLSELIAEGN